ncbi:MAG: hypothetical protein HY023_10715 [Chloroflexi bacterium]|nr:hypothetical protein [Chloroflexota bacterium]
MVALSLSPQVAEYLGHVKGQTAEEKVLALLEAYISGQLKECEREMGDYEVKYRSTFAEFAEAWATDNIPDKHSHAVERDYMEWEGLEAERRRLREASDSLTQTPST